MTAPTPHTHRAPSLVQTRAGRELVLAGAVATMVVEMASLALGATLPVGTLELSASAIPALLLLGLLGVRGAGRTVERDRVVPFWIAMAAGLALGVGLFTRTGHGIEVLGLLVAATNEEVVFRFAVPVVITAALMVVKVPAPPARFVGYLAAGTWWVLLPGHRAQVESLANLGTYIAFAFISAVVVARSRALIPMSIAHCVLNIITFAQLRGEISPASRSALVACLLVLLVGTFAWPDRAAAPAAAGADEGPAGTPAGDDLVSDTVIDLRDGQRPSVRHGDDVTWLDDEPAPTDDGAAPVEAAAEDAGDGGVARGR